MLHYLVATIEVWGYPAIFLGGFIEGLNVTLVSSFLVAQGFFSFVGIFLASALGNYLSDLMWYGVGKRYGFYALERNRIYHPLFRMIAGRGDFHWMKGLLGQHTAKVLTITKFSIGPGIATQIASGAMGTSFRRYASASLLANAIFTAVLIAIGYGFGQSYRAAARIIRNVGLLIFLLIGAAIFLEMYGRRWVRSFIQRIHEPLV